ncbi:restriction endonuclease subunit S [Tissierella sp.]|uniref:restriction endonuclease subunit S n=1 Tax=Tissierella sp. TaxID=41274 RepID=UPI0028555FFE|nr:restriction endonuclease subunit S [Tissierella sp.]MDR7855508.1 restriction endonuclease subunit S [Tissierella sp.]
MRLIKEKLGKYIERVENRNTDLKYGINDVRGISNSKQIQQTKADISDRNFDKFQIVGNKNFVFNRRTTRMGEKIGLGFNNTGEEFIVTEDYVVFKVSDIEVILPEYLFIFFNRPEFDRYSRWDSWGSATEFFNWGEMCDVSITIPPLPIQQKYVDVYNAMLANQQCYERGLEDLKLVCDAYIEDLRRNMPCKKIKTYLSEVDERNDGNKVKLARGVDINMQFIEPKRVAEDFEKGKIVQHRQFAYNKVMKANGTKLPLALRDGEDCVISGSYQVFQINDENELYPEYLMLWLSRPETQRYLGFNSWGSTRDVVSFDEIGDITIPIPDIEHQKSAANIYIVYISRKQINERLKAQIKDICPILIKGSIEEAEKLKEA